MEEVEVPQYFLCPITLQIMTDPVTTITGITYDRQSIEHWLSTSDESVCPATKQPLPKDTNLTPNHTLRRLIQAWCVANAENGVDRIPSPRTPLDKACVLKLIRNLSDQHLQSTSLKKLENLSSESEKNKQCLLESGVADATVSIMIISYKEGKISGLEECLKIINHIWRPTSEIKLLVEENHHELLESIMWMLNEKTNPVMQSEATLLTRKVFEVASTSIMERLGAPFINGMIRILKDKTSDLSRTNTALRVLIEISHCGKNRMKMIEANAIFDLVELALELGVVTGEEKKITLLIFSLLSQLCSCADGRARFLEHEGGIAVVSKRLLRVSPAVDDRAVHIFAMLTRFSGRNETLQEMLRVGAVSKLCMVLQVDCAKYLKDKARKMLRMHSSVWHNSPCIQVYLFTRYPTLQF